LLTVCHSQNVEIPHAILGLVQVLLHRYTLADTITAGISTDRILPVRTDYGGPPSLQQSLLRTAAAAVEAERHGVPFAQLQAWSEGTSASADEPLFRVLVCIPPERESGVGEGGRELDGARRRCDVSFRLLDHDGQVTVAAEYDPGLYNASGVLQILTQVVFLLESLDQLLKEPVDTLPLWPALDALERVRRIGEQSKHCPTTRCMHERFEECVRRTPDAVALVMPGDKRREMTYGQLNASANRLAHYLQAKGARPEMLIGVYLDRTPDLVIAILAILKAGAAYLPIDLCYPLERVELMLKDTEAPLILTHSQLAGSLPNTAAEVLSIDDQDPLWASLSPDNPVSGTRPDNIIYSIFTSGSTGIPKGALITHANVSRLFDATRHWFHFDERDTWTLFHSCAFDFSVWELWGALIYGGRLVIVPFSSSRSPERFHALLAEEGVTVLNQTPSAFSQLMRVDEAKVSVFLRDLRLVIFGGEALNLQGLRGWFEKYGDAKPRLVNMYGITETTVHVTYRPLSMTDVNQAPGSMIGVPIPDLQVYVLDRAMRPVPDGVPGELFVGGGGVTRGYLKREKLTGERFLVNPFPGQVGGKLYRTGDLARRLPGGDLEYLGRCDQQVKISGFRVELGEIESALRGVPGIREALVIPDEDESGDKFLAAYLVPSRGETPAIETLRAAARATLPEYMVPSAFAFLCELPLTPHGKVDRAALPPARICRSNSGEPLLAPQTDTERAVAQVYREVLHMDEVGLDDNFFDIGGTSLKLAHVHTRLQTSFGRDFPITDLFAHPTVRGIAQHLGGSGRAAGQHAGVLARAERQRLAMAAGRRRKL
jgi:amino acid adenylation domain-containing protein